MNVTEDNWILIGTKGTIKYAGNNECIAKQKKENGSTIVYTTFPLAELSTWIEKLDIYSTDNSRIQLRNS